VLALAPALPLNFPAMNPPAKKLPWTMAIGVLLLFLTFSLAFLLAQIKTRALYGPSLPSLGPVAGFTLTNEDSRAISLTDLTGHVWVADIIFTRCAGPCLRMSRQMKELQDALGADSRVKLVSLTTDADFDTPPVLKHTEKLVELKPLMFLTARRNRSPISR
jgi:cytochrome oxidase Cu insertion factor (SCO1/SenC/PrrC family)